MARITLIEPYYGGSHKAWADGWAKRSRHQIDLLTLPGSFWRWRMRGGAVSLAEQLAAHVAATGQPDAVVVSEMVDVASLLGLARHVVAGCPVAVYMHENQLLYPDAPTQRRDDAAALTNWRSMLAADAVWFNSAFHRDALHASLPQLLDRQSEPRHTHLIDAAFARTAVLWPGVETKSLIAGERAHNATPLVLWNQRWDHDKNPQAVFSALVRLADEGVRFELALAGENHRVDPQEFIWAQERLGDRVVHVGHLDRASYVALLLRSDVVVSAANHEFFGIALVEAMAAGAVPVLPDRLSFPELVASQWHASALYADGELRRRLGHVLEDVDRARTSIEGLRETMGQFDWSEVTPRYDDEVDRLISSGPGHSAVSM